MYRIRMKRVNKYSIIREDAMIQIGRYNPDAWGLSTRNIVDPHEIVIVDNEIIIDFDYPLSSTFSFKVRSLTDHGFTRKMLVDAIVLVYQTIYREENETSTIREEMINNGSPLTRNRTNGYYAIHSYRLEDLMLEKLEYDPATQKVKIYMGHNIRMW